MMLRLPRSQEYHLRRRRHTLLINILCNVLRAWYQRIEEWPHSTVRYDYVCRRLGSTQIQVSLYSCTHVVAENKPVDRRVNIIDETCCYNGPLHLILWSIDNTRNPAVDSGVIYTLPAVFG